MKMIVDLSMSADTVENMFPFERDVYIALLLEAIEKKKQENGIT